MINPNFFSSSNWRNFLIVSSTTKKSTFKSGTEGINIEKPVGRRRTGYKRKSKNTFNEKSSMYRGVSRYFSIVLLHRLLNLGQLQIGIRLLCPFILVLFMFF